jgi:hypothetical protein
VKRWSVSVVAEGDRVMTREEIVALADAVAPDQGIATGIGATAYGAQIVVEAATGEEAAETGIERLRAAAAQAGLPAWPVTRAEVIGEDDETGEDQTGADW